LNEISTQKHGMTFLLSSLVLTGVLYVVPFGNTIAWPLILLSTLAHEMGHGLTAVLVGGDFHKFYLHADASGVAYTSTQGDLAGAAVSAGGLVGPAIVGALFFMMAHRARGLFFTLGVGLVLAEVFVVRNLFGLTFVGIVAVFFLWLASTASKGVQQIAAYFVGIQLALSVFSRGDYLFTPTAQTASGNMPSDVAHMAEALFLPYWFWGAACGLFSLVCLVIGIRSAIQTLRE
jgi:hypothetical protein